MWKFQYAYIMSISKYIAVWSPSLLGTILILFNIGRYELYLLIHILASIPGGDMLLPKLYVNVPAGSQKFDFLLTHFLHNYPPISTFLKEMHPILLKLCAFYHNLLKIHPI